MTVEEDKQAILAAFRRNNAEAFALALESLVSRVWKVLEHHEAAAEALVERAESEASAGAQVLLAAAREDREKLRAELRAVLDAARKGDAEARAAGAAAAAEQIHMAGRAAVADLRKLLSAAAADLSKRTAAAAVATAEAGLRARKWTVAATVAIVIALAAASAAGMVLGRAHALATVRDEQAAASWANTPDGNLAYRMMRAGSLEDVARCRGEGWVEKQGVCYPHPAPDGRVFGWRLPLK